MFDCILISSTVVFIPPAAGIENFQPVEVRKDLLQCLLSPPTAEGIKRMSHTDKCTLPAQAPHDFDGWQTLRYLLGHEVAQ